MITLSAEQCRIIGVMLEKETTTPEQYPMSLNGITTACNQKSNREPVMSLLESEVQNSIDELSKMNQLMIDHKASGRVSKYYHYFCDTEFGNLKFSPQQRAIVCVLLLRGPQTPGELRARSGRLHSFADNAEVVLALTSLMEREGEALVIKLPRTPGRKDSEYMHLFSGEVDVEAHASAAQAAMSAAAPERISMAELVERVSALEEEVAALKKLRS